MLDIGKIEQEADIQVRKRGIKKETKDGWYELIYEPAVMYGVLAKVGSEVSSEEHKSGFEECQTLMFGILKDRIKCYTDMRRSKKSKCIVSIGAVLNKEPREIMEETVEATKTTILEALPLVLIEGKGEDYDRILKDTKELLVEFKALNEKHLSAIRRIYLDKHQKGEEQENPILMHTGKPNINTTGYLGNIKHESNKEDR
jgi:hypothetical protein